MGSSLSSLTPESGNKKGKGEVNNGRVMSNIWGNHPESEEEFYASQRIRSTSSYFTSPSTGLPLFTRSWLPPDATNDDDDDDSNKMRGVILMVHGYGNDISWSFQWTPIFLAQHGFACYALDLPGHGRSYGLKAFVPDLNPLIHDCISYFNSIITCHQQQGSCKYFLFGESMGGAICLLIHLQQQHRLFDGAVLVAPMCKISDTIRPPWPLPHFLSLAAYFFPTLPIVPTPDLISKSVKVEEKRSIAAANPMRYDGKPRLGTVLQLLRVTDHLSARLGDVTIPFIVLHGAADAVTDPEVSRELYDKASSSDKTINIYPGMMHSLLFGEADDNIDRVRRDILEWLNQRCNSN